MVNAANLAMAIAVVFSVVPAMTVLFFMLRRFEGFFDEKRLFRQLMVGMVLGAGVTLVQVVLLGFHDPLKLQVTSVGSGFGALLAVYPLMDSAAKTVALNWRSLAGRIDTPYYGTALGLGFGAISSFFIVAGQYNALLRDPGFGALSHLEIATTSALLFVLFCGGMILHGVAGAYIGRSTGNREPWRALAWGSVLALPYYVGYYAFFASGTVWVRFLAPVAVLVVGYALMRHTILTVLEGLVPEELAKQVRRDLRKKARGAGPGAAPPHADGKSP